MQARWVYYFFVVQWHIFSSDDPDREIARLVIYILWSHGKTSFNELDWNILFMNADMGVSLGILLLKDVRINILESVICYKLSLWKLSLTLCGAVMSYGFGNGLMADDTKPLPEPLMTSY